MPHDPHRYSAPEIEALWRVLRERRDMRHFTPAAQDAPERLDFGGGVTMRIMRHGG